MIITLTGDNLYRLDGELEGLKQKLGLDKSDLGVTKIYGNEVSLEEIKMELSSLSLFSDQRLIILENPSKVKGLDEYLAAETEDIPESTTLALVEPKLDKRKTFYKFLKSKTDFRELNKLGGPALIKWAIDYSKEKGKQLSTAAASYLIDRVGDDQLLLSQELEKLAIYPGEITKEAIDLLTEQTVSTTIFELLDSAFSLNPKRALKLYNDQRLQKVEPEEILAMMAWQLSTLAIYMTSKDLPPNEAIAISGISPYALSKARQIAAKLSFGSLKSLVSELANLDFSYKTSSLDLDEGLKNFIVTLSY